MGLRKPRLEKGDVIEVFVEDEMADAEAPHESVDLEILGQMQMCWHYTAFEEKTGRHFSVFIDSEGRLWTKEFHPITYPVDEGVSDA